MLRLMLSSIRSRLGNFAGALVAITIATSLIAGTCLLLFAAADADITSDRYGAAAAIVQVDPANPNPDEDDASLTTVPRIDASLAEAIARVPGVAQAIPGLSFYAQILDKNGDPIPGPDDTDSYGFPWSNAALAPFSLIAGAAPADGQVVIDERLAHQGGYAVGDTVTVLTAQMPTAYMVSGIAAAPSGDSLPKQASIFFAEGTASAITGAGNQADFIGVIAQPGIDARTVAQAIAEALDDPSLRILTGDELGKADPTSDQQAFDDVTALLGTMAGFSGFVSIFVLAGTFAFSILQRNREIGLLRSIGMTPRQVKLMIAGEGLLLALIASAIALPLGYVIALAIAAALAHFDLAPDGFSAGMNAWSFLIAIGGSIGISQLASFGAARRAARIRPIDALRESAVPAKRLPFLRFLTGLGFVAGGIVVLAISPGLDADAQVAMSLAIATIFLIAASRLGPMLVRPVAALMGRVLGRVFGEPGELAWRNSRYAANRVSSVVSPLMLATGFACLMFFLVATMQTATIAQSTDRTIADAVVVADGPGLPVEMVDRITQLPGVSAASGVSTAPVTLIKPHGDWDEYVEQIGAGIDPSTISAVLDLDVTHGSLDGFTTSSMAISRMAAEFIDADPGEQFDVVFPDGYRTTLTVAAIFENGLGFPDLAVSSDLMLAHAGQPMVQEIYVDASDGAQAQVVAEIEPLQSTLPTMEVLSGKEYVSTIKQSAVDGAWAIYLIIGVSVLFAAISVINTMAMSTAERSREFSLLRLIGATDRQIMRMVLGEALIVLALGLALGVGIGWISMVPASNAMVGDLSAITIPPLETTIVVVLAAAIALTAHLLPARFALRLDPMANIGLKQ
jgi:putative ABC transport system permease protein